MVATFHSPEIDVTWKTPKKKVALSEFNTKLRILLITKDDEGDYYCTGKNAAGTKTETISVTVKGKLALLRSTSYIKLIMMDLDV